MFEQIVVFTIIGIMLVIFIDGRLRYDFVALAGIIILGLFGIIEYDEVFSGFSHPAVITVGSVLVISDALIKIGVMDNITSYLNRDSDNTRRTLISLMAITAGLSAFMNNVGALAVILPITISIAKDSDIAPSKLLMPVAFASLLGGMVTSIGTPPNLIVSMFREQEGYPPFAFFDFAPVGLSIVVIGIAFVVGFGYKLIPNRESKNETSLFKTEDYLSEIVITENSKVVGLNLREVFLEYKVEVEVLSIIRNDRRIAAPKANQVLRVDDVILVRAETTELARLVEKTGVELKGAKLTFLDSKPYLKSDNIELVEVVLKKESILVGKTAMEALLRNRYNVNVVAVSREGVSSFERLKSFRFEAGDVLLLQVPKTLLEDTYHELGCLPLAEREIGINIGKTSGQQLFALSIFAIAILLTSIGIVPVQMAFATTAIIYLFSRIITPEEFYNSLELPTLVMLGALLPLGNAIQSSGASDTIATLLINVSSLLPVWGTLPIIMIITMILTNLIGNYASTVIMAPIAVSVARDMGVSPDSLLMGVSIAASSAFLTPIGHQSNMLVMGPGGYKFTDYWRLGLPLSILVIVTGTPLLLYFWPL